MFLLTGAHFQLHFICFPANIVHKGTFILAFELV